MPTVRCIRISRRKYIENITCNIHVQETIHNAFTEGNMWSTKLNADAPFSQKKASTTSYRSKTRLMQEY